jgi:hypothetical protein
MTDFSGNHPRDWLPPPGQTPPGAMSVVYGGNANIRAEVARDAAELRKYVPRSTFEISWHGLDEHFQRNGARLVSVELYDFLVATEAQNRPSTDTGPPSPTTDVKVVATSDFFVRWTPPATAAEASKAPSKSDDPIAYLEHRIAELEAANDPAARQAAAQADAIAAHFPPAARVYHFKAGVPQDVPPALARFLRDTGHPVK